MCWLVLCAIIETCFVTGTDEKAIIGVIGARSSDQRQKIKTTYKQAYGRVGE